MFLHLLTDAQQRALLGLAKQFVEADERLSSEEHNLLEMMLAESGLPFDIVLPEEEPAVLSRAFDSRQSRAAALLEIIGVGHADGEFHPEENAFVRDLAPRLQITPEEVAAMDAWVLRQLDLATEVEQFWRD